MHITQDSEQFSKHLCDAALFKTLSCGAILSCKGRNNHHDVMVTDCDLFPSLDLSILLVARGVDATKKLRTLHA